MSEERRQEFMRNRKLGRMVKVAAVAGVVLAGITPVHAQFASPTGDRGPLNTTFGGNYKDPQQRAADNLTKGLRFKAKADEEPDTRKKAKLLDKAKKEFQSSIALHPNHDAYLALGLVQMHLGNAQASLEACMQAVVLKPGSAAAEDCALSAQRKLQEGQGEGGGGQKR